MSPRSAYQTALNILSRRDHFRRELVEKLRAKDYPPGEIEEAVGRCEELGLVDDERVGRRFVEIRAGGRGWGPHRLAAELKHRGVESGDAERLSHLPPDLAAEAMRTALRKLKVRAPEGWWRDSQRRARMVSSLITRGFETDVAIAAVDDLAASRENQDHALDDQ
jgi:regulatory protein